MSPSVIPSRPTGAAESREHIPCPPVISSSSSSRLREVLRRLRELRRLDERRLDERRLDERRLDARRAERRAERRGERRAERRRVERLRTGSAISLRDERRVERRDLLLVLLRAVLLGIFII